MRSRLVASAVVSLAIFAAIAVDFHPSGPMYAITIGGFAAPAQAQSAAGIEARNEVVRGRMSIMNERQELHVERKRQESAESVRGRFPKAGAQRKLPLESDLPRVDDAETVEPQG
jgi:hypothetical protein